MRRRIHAWDVSGVEHAWFCFSKELAFIPLINVRQVGHI
jgi:hypothetical protein